MWRGFPSWCGQSPLCAGSLTWTFAQYVACILSALVSNECEGDNSPQLEEPPFLA